MAEEIYYQDNKESILRLNKNALVNCLNIVVDKKYNILEYDFDKEVLFTEDKTDLIVHGLLKRKEYLGWKISRGEIKPITMMYDYEDIAKQVVSSDKKFLEAKVFVKLSDGVAVFEYDINFDNLLRKISIKGGN